jgi:L-ribulose-5-phosphate 4-epimerase
MAIKPSGVPYSELSAAMMVVLEIDTGHVVEGDLNPSSDTPTHLELYRAFPCTGVVHTHSEFATTLAQACLPVRCMGTTQADYFYGDVPVTRNLTEQEVSRDYEANTGRVIVETFRGKDPMSIPGVLVANHGPFTWGTSAQEAVHHAMVLEFVARMECMLRGVRADAPLPARFLIDKHYLRKHGENAYYGQRSP